MKRQFKRTICKLIAAVACGIFLGGVCIPTAQPAQAYKTNNLRILFISAYSYGWDTVQIQIEGIKAGVPEGTVLDYEFMDTKRVDDETSGRQFYEGLSYRLSMVEPYDAVILGDDAALLFALEYQDELFANTPLVFEGVNNLELAKRATEDPLISGVVEASSVEENIRLALRISPNATRVVAILDNSVTGEAERINYYQCAELFPWLEFTEINASEISSARMKNTLSNLTKDTILIYMVMTQDGDGKQYTNKEAIELITQYAPIPVLRMVESGIGWGVLGGSIVSMELSGEIAAQMAVKMAQGKMLKDDLVDSPNIYCIDEAVVKKFGIDRDVFPRDTEWINHKVTFMEKNREIVIPCSVLIVALIAVLIWIYMDNYKRRKLTKELEESRSYLSNASQHDFLTGLPNRSKFMADLQESADKGAPFSLVMLDIDNFKHINDTYGHVTGDEALQGVASRLKALKTDLLTAYRFAGDEFILILKSANDKIVQTAAMQCLAVFQKPFKLSDGIHDIHGSIGVASYPTDEKNSEKLIECADAAMYSIKKSGKNAYAFYKDINKEEIEKEE